MAKRSKGYLPCANHRLMRIRSWLSSSVVFVPCVEEADGEQLIVALLLKPDQRPRRRAGEHSSTPRVVAAVMCSHCKIHRDPAALTSGVDPMADGSHALARLAGLREGKRFWLVDFQTVWHPKRDPFLCRAILFHAW